MKTISIQTPSKGLISYTDHKRYLWLLSLTYPIFPLSALAIHFYTGNAFALWLPIIGSYLFVPLADWVLGEDTANPPEELVPTLEKDRYYQRLLYFTVPLHFITFFACAYWIATQNLSPLAYLAVAISAGMTSGLGINTGHELGHKSDPFGRLMAKLVLAVPGYGHFCIEHNAGHHVHVATPEDPASSKMGENIYRFALREIPGGFKRGWNLEQRRLKAKGLNAWSWKNDVLQSYFITAVMQVSLIILIGWLIVPFLILHNFFAWWQLTSANYIEHYGLLREKKDNGRYARCEPYHSWNSNHIASNLLLFHLERHSDHHAHPTRHYQSLRHFEHLPTLPNCYAGTYLIAYIPWLWYKVMDKKLLQLHHIQGDMSKVNVLESKRTAIQKKYAELITT